MKPDGEMTNIRPTLRYELGENHKYPSELIHNIVCKFIILFNYRLIMPILIHVGNMLLLRLCYEHETADYVKLQ